MFLAPRHDRALERFGDAIDLSGLSEPRREDDLPYVTRLITLGRYSISGRTSEPVLGSIMGLTSKHASVQATVSHTVLSAKKRPGQILRYRSL